MSSEASPRSAASYRGDIGEIQGRYGEIWGDISPRSAASWSAEETTRRREIQGRYRGDVGEVQGRCRPPAARRRPRGHYISLYLTISPYISLYLPISPYISCSADETTRSHARCAVDCRLAGGMGASDARREVTPPHSAPGQG